MSTQLYVSVRSNNREEPEEPETTKLEAWRAADDNLPPYLRSTLPPWVEPTSISMPPEGSMT